MKKHFIFLGAPGVIYYSWLLALVFIGVTFAYESNKSISWTSVVLCCLFGIGIVYTFINSYLKIENNTFIFKLPFRKLAQVEQPQLLFSWHFISIYKIKDSYEEYSILIVENRKKNARGN